jgi:hypothetical protein
LQTTQAELELALGMKRPTIVFLRNRQHIGTYGLESLPTGLKVVDDASALRDALLAEIAPFAISRPTFKKLRENYTTDPNNIHKCSMSFPNTCAIRMSEALGKISNEFLEKFAQSGLNLCPHNYMRGAQDLASVLRKADVLGVYDGGFSQPGSAPSEISGKKGIVAYMRIPGYDGQGHIDLWDGSAPVGDSYWSAETVWFWKLT